MLAIGGAFAVVGTVAFAQTGNLKAPSKALQVQVQADATAPPAHASVAESDLNQLRSAIALARVGDIGGSLAAAGEISDPTARKLAHWALADVRGGELDFARLEPLRRELDGWPRSLKRRDQTEAILESSGLDATAVVGWFAGAEPRTPAGVMALASAYQETGRPAEALALIKTTWRTQPFDAETQSQMLSRFGGLLSADDHAARANLLAYGPQGPALKALIPLLAADQQALIQARVALRGDAKAAPELAAAVPAALRGDGGLAYERTANLRRRNQPDLALQLAVNLPANLASEEAASRVWTERRQLINVALKRADYRAAYDLAAKAGMSAPSDIVDAEFFAGWLALSRLKDPTLADSHFARIQAAGNAPITQARALYWRGRAHAAQGDKAGADAFYGQAARYAWTFYGQLAAGEANLPIALGADPTVTADDRARFNDRDLVKAARILADLGERDLFRAFVLFTDDQISSPAEFAQLVDVAAAGGDQDLALRVVRVAAQKGVFLPGRGYPAPMPPAGAVDPALVLGVIRQESGFDARARSPVDARGLMQLMPATAQLTANRVGVPYALDSLYEPAYNMQLGQAYLGQLIDRFTGSYVLAVASYNAGPNRADEWITYCGDPRAPGVDAVDFIECIPFSETRNYVMRVLEGAQVYRAKLAKTDVPATLASDLKRGGQMVAALQAP